MTTRRDFLSTSGSAVSGAWLARFAPLLALTQACARDAMIAGGPFVTFTDREAADFDAFAARIVPTDDTPGAREAGAVYFADQALATHFADFVPVIRAGLEAMGARAADSFGAGSFADLAEARQDEIIGAVETEDPFFFTLGRWLVVLGLVTNPEYGGNRDKVGWSMLGFEDSFRHEPPFGWYDRNEHGTGSGEGA